MIKPKFSIIMPAYNVQSYIATALDSLVNQTYNNFELIVINDCSTDNTMHIVNQYKNQYKFIKVYNHGVNLGLSASRNTGLQYATGEFVMFVDSDDWLPTYALKRLFNHIAKYNTDLILIDYFKYYNPQKCLQQHKDLNPNKIYSTHTDKKIILQQGGVTAWQKVYKNSFLQQHKLKFINNIVYEDVPYHWVAILLSSSISYLPSALYYYRKRSGSIMQSKVSGLNFNSCLVVDSYLHNFLYNHNLFSIYLDILQSKLFKMHYAEFKKDINNTNYLNTISNVFYNYNATNNYLNMYYKTLMFLIKKRFFTLLKIINFKK